MATLTPATAKKRGMSRAALYRATRNGKLERIARGIYLPADATAADWDWIEAATRRPESTICLTSALALHDLTDEIPATLDIAIHRGARIPAGSSAITWHHFDKATFDLGREQIAIPGTDQTIGLYSAERSIADAFRLRSAMGYELPRDALKEWLRRGGKPGRLVDLTTRLPRAKTPLLTALDALS
ncbi:type IV toxin-antitoxin system AbiEi family antitoxin domain-containing protein [Ornithinimicrobium faecis]|uniref:type IV toxin-antitoxin system AbiEi family antitoxin domain-containing protein n=1 Tax=Ornithinimicrobium faecis TaxID=2934158 RepID=UPI002117B7DB|nr:type IV toxin-antitoxin system AbiEi family antitoxin domain-containing protein [Ornithinimicrobium sp. HY1745]